MIQENRNLLLYSTSGASMFPFIRWNEYILVKRVPLDSISLGDAIVFGAQGKDKICHRVVRVEEVSGKFWFYTKGDKNKFFDGPVSQGKILGRVIAIKRRGRFIKLSTRDFFYFIYKLQCALIENSFLIKTIFAKVHIFKKIYRYAREKINNYLK